MKVSRFLYLKILGVLRSPRVVGVLGGREVVFLVQVLPLQQLQLLLAFWVLGLRL
jgi:hypothetical protein